MSNSERPQSADLRCHVCRYDLRAHADADVCPECGTAVSQSREVALVPIRPAWRDSDPRWRRRMLLGVWLIVLMPAMHILKWLGVTELLPAPKTLGSVRSLDDTYFADGWLFSMVLFAVGIALLLTPERGRRRRWLDRTHRWGILCCAFVMLIDFLATITIVTLVALGLSSLLMSIPPAFQPEMTPLLATLSSSYARFGPLPDTHAYLIQDVCTTIAVALACVPLLSALRSTGLRFWAYVVVSPILGLAVVKLLGIATSVLEGVINWEPPIGFDQYFFNPGELVDGISALARRPFSLSDLHQSLEGRYFYLEAIKWGVFLVIAVWLTIAQIRARSATTRGV